MGRKVTISELKKWDVFSFDGYNYFVLIRRDSKGFSYSDLNGDGDFYQMIFELEVELLGRMEFKKEPTEDIDLEIARIMRTGRY